MENEVTTKMEGPGQEMTKDPKKVAAGDKLAEYNHRKREELQGSKCWGCCSCWGVRCSWLLLSPIQERNHQYCHQDDSGSIFRISNPEIRKGVTNFFWIAKWT